MAKKTTKTKVTKSNSEISTTTSSLEIINTGDVMDVPSMVEDEIMVIAEPEVKLEIKRQPKEKGPQSPDGQFKLNIDSQENIKGDLPTTTLEAKTENIIHSEAPFSLLEKIFIEVHKSNILQYFSSGCIYPNKYSSQKAFSDPQSINENGLLLSNGLISYDADHVLIQIDSSALNNSLLSLSNSFALYSGIIPLSRIIAIHVGNSETKKKTLNDSLIRDAGIIPESLIMVGFPNNLSKVSVVELNITQQNFESQLNQYDKILGLIAGTRNFNLLTYNQTGKFKTISDHSFFAIQAINETFAAEIITNSQLSDYYKWLFTNSCPSERPLLQWLYNRIQTNINFTDSDTTEFESLCNKTNSFPGEEKKIKEIFAALRKSLERKKAMTNILALESKNSLTLYVFAYLRTFGTNQNPELPRVELTNSKVTKYSEFAFALLNFHFGYKQLRNSEDRLSISDDTIKSGITIPTKPTIKFELTTEFDYRIMDSVFNFIFGIKKRNFVLITVLRAVFKYYLKSVK